MYIGIDVGGTYTDGVSIRKGKVVRAVKAATSKNTADSIIQALEQLIQDENMGELERIVLSTTLITNTLAQDKQEPVGILLMPGPGSNPLALRFAAPSYLLKGAVDYRGRIVEEPDMGQVAQGVDFFLRQGIRRIAVACKFSQRNPILEEKIVKYIQTQNPGIKVLASHKVSGTLNWVRRANGAVFTLAVEDQCRDFIRHVKMTLEKLGIKCPVYLLKADGGTLPLSFAADFPLETIFSGPAASALGALAIAGNGITTVVMDIGGTTTDLALILNGIPLLAERGATLAKYAVPVRAMAVSSAAIGGDTSVRYEKGQILLGERLGPALCLGGSCLTITDILAYQGYTDVGDKNVVVTALEELATAAGISAEEICSQVLELFLRTLEDRLQEMFRAWEEEPAYRIWQVLAQKTERPAGLVCLGGPAQGLGLLWGKKKGWEVTIPQYAAVANAVGAALAKDTLKLDFYADTERMIYSTNLGGIQGQLTKKLKSTDEAQRMALEIFQEVLRGQNNTEKEVSITYEESFNMVRGWNTTGKIFQIGLQSPSGIITSLEGVPINE